jgi:hypothetical protein
MVAHALVDRLVLRPALAQETGGVEIVTQNVRYPDDRAAVLFRMDVEDCIVELLVAVSCLRTGILLVAEA